ncbi:hypothetical protein BH10PLA2_BH10PLA2_06530 [soil metagenome]
MAKNLFKFVCVLLAMSAGRVQAAGPEDNAVCSRGFSIPVTIAGGSQEKLKAVELYVSTDDGRTWNQQSSITPDRGEFIYTAPTDGMYWFKVCTIDKAGNKDPKDPFKEGKASKILVDTLPPTVRIVKTERQGENVVVFWEVQELNPELNSFKLEYRMPDGTWYPTSITPAMVGQQSFRSPNRGPFKVRVTVSDVAGNQTPMEADVVGKADDIASNLTTTSMQVPGVGGMQTSNPNPSPVFPTNPAPAPVIPTTGFTAPPVQSNALAQSGSTPPTIPNNPVVPSMANSGQPGGLGNHPNNMGGIGTQPDNLSMNGSSSPATNASSSSGMPTNVYQNKYLAGNNSAAPPQVNSSLPTAPANLIAPPSNSGIIPVSNERGDTMSQPPAGSNSQVRYNERTWSAPPPRAAGGIGLPPGNPPDFVATRWINNVQTTVMNNTQITLNYEVGRVGPSGVSAVELYLTDDEGHTWKRYDEDADLKPPMIVDLPGEGVYGLKLLVKNKAGLHRRPPQDGEAPEMRVEVDMTPPAVKLYRPEPDPRRRDSLVLAWQATDERSLANNPITLQVAERPEGPWENIASNITNTNRYVWKVKPGLTYVHLRVVARDVAGNQGYDQTQEPILVDLTEPDARITGISSGAKRP